MINVLAICYFPFTLPKHTVPMIPYQLVSFWVHATDIPVGILWPKKKKNSIRFFMLLSTPLNSNNGSNNERM